jgi:hypothetical protein
MQLCFNSSVSSRSVGWSVGWSVDRSVGRSVGWSVGRSVGRSVDWSVGRLVGRSVGWLVGPLVGWLVGQSKIRVPGLWEVSLQKDKACTTVQTQGSGNEMKKHG